jgi:CYTH domain-containing protein
MNSEPSSPTDSDREQSAEMPREIEAKIINLGDPEDFKKRLMELDAVLIDDRRLLQDRSFKQKKDQVYSANDLPFNSAEIKDPTDLQNVLELLGVDIVSEPDENGVMVIRPREGAPVRMVRIRAENDHTILTVKEKRNKQQTVDNRAETELELLDETSLQQLLDSMGYLQSGVKEKYRTSYGLEGCKVELNEGPVGAPWAEIEADSEEKVLEIAQRLGYDQTDLKGMSDNDYYRLKMPELLPEDLDNLTFARMQSEREAEPSE